MALPSHLIEEVLAFMTRDQISGLRALNRQFHRLIDHPRGHLATTPVRRYHLLRIITSGYPHATYPTHLGVQIMIDEGDPDGPRKEFVMGRQLDELLPLISPKWARFKGGCGMDRPASRLLAGGLRQ